jgi:hypothetical protein
MHNGCASSTLDYNYCEQMFLFTVIIMQILAQNFSITLMNLGNQTLFDSDVRSAANRWEQIIIGDLPDVQGGTKNWFAKHGNYTGPIDDIIIGYDFSPIDGNGGILGNAGPLYLRPEPIRLPYSGILKLDRDDLMLMKTNGLIRNVLIHEMGHCLGLGTLWTSKKCINCTLPNFNTTYNCPNANREFALLSNKSLKIEGNMTAGSRCVHWSSAMGQEIMVPFAYRDMPISRVTIGSLADLGYVVNYSQADNYSLPAKFFSNSVGLKFNTKLMFGNKTV